MNQSNKIQILKSKDEELSATSLIKSILDELRLIRIEMKVEVQNLAVELKSCFAISNNSISDIEHTDNAINVFSDRGYKESNGSMDKYINEYVNTTSSNTCYPLDDGTFVDFPCTENKEDIVTVESSSNDSLPMIKQEAFSSGKGYEKSLSDILLPTFNEIMEKDFECSLSQRNDNKYCRAEKEDKLDSGNFDLPVPTDINDLDNRPSLVTISNKSKKLSLHSGNKLSLSSNTDRLNMLKQQKPKKIKVFKQKQPSKQIKSDVLTDFAGSTKKFPCMLCTSSFHKKHDLSRHMRIHTGERPFVCSQCSKSFVRAEHLRVHQLRPTCQKRTFRNKLCTGNYFHSGTTDSNI